MVEVPRDALATLRTGSTPVDAIDDAAISALRASGATIDRVDGTYELSDTDGAAAVAAGIDRRYQVEYFDSVDSTNRIARIRADAGDSDVVVIARTQTGGSGRRDRGWHSPPGGVWLSIVTHPTVPRERMALVTFAAAVAVVDAARTTGVDTVIKWPNDVLDPSTGKKLAGILTETGATAAENPFAVVGIGVNAAVPPAELPDDATSLQATTADVDPSRVAQQVVASYTSLRDSPTDILDRWRDHAATLGQPVRVTTDTDTITGTAETVTASGALRIDTAGGSRTVTAGECEHLTPIE